MVYLTVGRLFEHFLNQMETAYLSPQPGASRPGVQKGQTSPGRPLGVDLSPPQTAPSVLPCNSLQETPASSDGRRNPGVKKHHHKHNLKHRYELLETLGRGTYGKVKKAIERHSGREVSHLKRHSAAVNILHDVFKCLTALRTALVPVALRGLCMSLPWGFPKAFMGPGSCGCTRLVQCGASRLDAGVATD